MDEIIIDQDPGKTDEPQVTDEQTPVTSEPVKDDEKKETVGYPDVKIEGETVSYEDLKKGYMQEKDYTQKAQKLSEESKELDRLRAMAKYIDDPANADSVAKIQKLVAGEEPQPSAALEDEYEDESVKALRLKLEETQKTVADMQKTSLERDEIATKREIASEVQAVKGKYKHLGDEDIDTIMAVSIANDGVGLMEVADKYAKKIEADKKAAVKAYLEARDDDKNNFLEAGNAPPPVVDRKLSLTDGSAAKAFAKTLRESGGD